jgi:glycosyltransferase involved in cell wall biosynthesis
MKDQITIGLPVYKRTDYIRAALDSAVNQTEPCSILLIDNNSPHHEFKKIVESYSSVDIKYVRTEETAPQDENFNNCFRYADTPWVTVLHDDDMLHCQYVETCMKIIEKYGDRVGGISFPSHVGEEEWEGISQRREITDDFRIMNPAYFYFRNIAFPGVLVKKDVALEIGGFNSDLHPIADFDFWYRYSNRETMFYSEQEMSYYRISPSQSTNHLIDGMINQVYKYRRKEIEAGKHNNFLTRLSLEYARLVNIKYFLDTYDSVELPPIVNEDKLNRARKILKYEFSKKIVRRHMERLKFSSPG